MRPAGGPAKARQAGDSRPAPEVRTDRMSAVEAFDRLNQSGFCAFSSRRPRKPGFFAGAGGGGDAAWAAIQAS